MKRNKNFLLLLLTMMIYSCNNQQTNESSNIASSDTIKSQTKEKVLEKDTIKSSTQKNVAFVSSSNTASIVNPKLIQPTDNSVSLSDIFKQFEKTQQIFSFTSGKDTTFICKEGTKINIKAKSFVSEKTGKEINGIIQISVKEYYKLSDIILANLSTTSGKDILETGGMIYITAFSKYESCILKKGQAIEISFPTKVKKEGMQLYSGNWEKQDHINWEKTNQVIEEYAPAFIVVEEMPVFPSGEVAMMNFIAKNFKYPQISIDNNSSGKVFVNFIVNEQGKVENVKVVRGVDDYIDKEAVRVIQSLPDWIPGKQKGKAVRVQFTVPINLTLDGNNIGNVDWDGKIIDTNSDSSINKAGAKNLTYYLLSSNQLGWINCDRNWQQTNKRINYIVSTENSNNSSVRIVFHKFKGVMDGLLMKNGYLFQQVPLDEDITIVAIIYKDNKPFLSIKNTKIETVGEKDLIFQPLTAESLKSEIKKLDKYN